MHLSFPEERQPVRPSRGPRAAAASAVPGAGAAPQPGPGRSRPAPARAQPPRMYLGPRTTRFCTAGRDARLDGASTGCRSPTADHELSFGGMAPWPAWRDQHDRGTAEDPAARCCEECGRRLLLLLLQSSTWVSHRTEHVSFRDDRSVVRRVNVEFHVPERRPSSATTAGVQAVPAVGHAPQDPRQLRTPRPGGRVRGHAHACARTRRSPSPCCWPARTPRETAASDGDPGGRRRRCGRVRPPGGQR